MLKRLELVGFKSFADKTQFDFAPGITGIVGPNGSGKCVAGSTLVTLADGRDVPIRELVEAALGGAKEVEALDDGALTKENPLGLEVLSLNQHTLRLEPRLISAFVKREAPDHLLRVRTRSGREVVATPYHPLFTLERGELRTLRADELQVGVRVALPRRLPIRGGEVSLLPFEVLQRFRPNDRIFVPNSEELRAWADRVRPRFKTWVQWRRAAGVPDSQFRGLLAGQAIQAANLVRLARTGGLPPPLDGHLKCGNTPKQMRLPATFSPQLARFLGLLIAEGRNSGTNQVRFTNADPAINEDFECLAGSLFGLNVQREWYKEAAEDGLIYSRALGLILERLFAFPIDSCSADKAVPADVFVSPAAVQWSFLSGLFEGDASVGVSGEDGKKSTSQIEYTSASRRLAEGVISLLLRLGIFARLRLGVKWATNTRVKRPKTYYTVYIYGADQLRQAARCLSFTGTKSAALQKLREAGTVSRCNLDIVPGVTPLVREAVRLAGMKLKPHRRQYPKLMAYVENRCEATRDGLLEVLGPIEQRGETPALAHDHLERFRVLATSDVYWDEVVAVERVEPPDEWVYDLCVSETHNFVAGNMIVHNSNIVDAVRWVLGEQSAKSLRGGEMTDVIFNGSAVRRSVGLAEVTMTFDNARRALATEAEEVQITRRVYRGGDSEYLLNHQTCRLKDIKDLFLGSGAGNDAYSIIEQGRVDVLLQASTKERRSIFEEAAGISRFKAKKAETLRRLERIDQNLQRLRDILDEVEKQLRSVKLQASKAQRYQEHSERLKALRVALGLREFGELTERLRADTAVLEGLRAGLAEQIARADASEQDLRRREEELARLEDVLRGEEAELAGARQQIASEETTLAHESAVVGDVENDLAQTRQRLAEWTRHVAELTTAAARAGEERRQAEAQCRERQEAAGGLEDALQATEKQLAALHVQVDRDKLEHVELMRQAAHRQNDAVSYKAQVDNLSRERTRLRLRSEQAAEQMASLDLELEELTAAAEALQARLGTARQALAAVRQERDHLHQVREAAVQHAADLRARRSGLASRIEVLEGLERSHEGLGTGAREVVALLEQPEPGKWRTVMGILAEFLTVRREYAPLIDLALGERAQRFLVRDAGLLAEALRERAHPCSGRVSFLPLEAPASAPAPIRRPEPAGSHVSARMPAAAEGAMAHPGVIALAEQVVRCELPELADLPARLLGKTLIVRDLTVARALVAHRSGYRCITLQGELLEADGTLTVGTHHAETGILSRKSELRELREQAVDLDRRLVEMDRDLADMRERLAVLDGQIEGSQTEVDVLAEQDADLRSRLGQHRQRRAGLHEEVEVSRTEMSGLEQEVRELEEAWQQARRQAAEAEARVQTLHARIEEADRGIRANEDARQRHQQEVTAARVALAQVEERLAGLRERHDQLEADLRRRGQEQAEAREHVRAMRARLEEGQRTLLQASSALANWYLRKETAERRLVEGNATRSGLREEQRQRTEEAQANRASWRAQQEQAHARELTVNDLRHQCDSLCARLQEDYQLDLAELHRLSTAIEVPPDDPLLALLASLPPLDPDAANEEIADLRKKLSRLGSVNLDAIQELNELEVRAGTLHIQHDDLAAAQRALQEIIATINEDSRRLFAETFATIRTHFQELFRKLFGGGMADVVLEDEGDILESGIEVIARPPGKELRSISLMSGGEKTMTAVALLLAIFESKPSPFCILDEVDAALDEANIGRFTSVLREFLDRSQFILITHSKRTMACADVLYGVTMQESGISRRFAVRFEDWPDDEKEPPEAKEAS